MPSYRQGSTYEKVREEYDRDGQHHQVLFERHVSEVHSRTVQPLGQRTESAPPARGVVSEPPSSRGFVDDQSGF